MKILFTCVGRRVELVQEFKKAGKELGLPLTVCATDMTNTAPAAYFCDEIFIAPRLAWRMRSILQGFALLPKAAVP